MADEKSELESRAQAMINALTAQRNFAQDQCVTLMGEIAVLQAQRDALAKENETLKPPSKEEPVDGGQ